MDVPPVLEVPFEWYVSPIEPQAPTWIQQPAQVKGVLPAMMTPRLLTLLNIVQRMAVLKLTFPKMVKSNRGQLPAKYSDCVV